MVENENLRKALEHYLQEKRDKLEEVRQLDLIIARLSRDLGEPAQAMAISEGVGDSMANEWRDSNEVALAPAPSRINVRPDDFFGMTYTAAATAYLEKVGHAVSMEELLDALNKGGCPVGGKEPKKTLYISLIRAVRVFVPIPGKSGYLGLRKFYPNLKTLKEESAPRPRRKKKLRKKRRMKAVLESSAKQNGGDAE